MRIYTNMSLISLKTMASSYTKSLSFSMKRSLSRARVRSPSIKSRPKEVDQKIEFLGNEEVDIFGDEEGERDGNKVMVVVDSSLEANGALDWALSHTIQTQDTILLAHVVKPARKGVESNKKLELKAFEVLHSMKIICQTRRPGVQVEVTLVEGKEKGRAIVEKAKQQKATLLVLGQKKRSAVWRFIKRLRWKRNNSGVAEYCIQNASCLTVAVRRKGKKLGGFLITTKRHKNFWLLA